MNLFYHSAGHDFHVVHCGCGAPLIAIYDASIRDTCSKCGGVSKVDIEAMRQEMKAEYLANIRQARRS